MESPSTPTEPTPSVLPPVRAVELDAPLRWLARGWRDLARAPAASLSYGALFAAAGWLIYWVFQHRVELVTAVTAGFLLVGPFLATGLYDISRRLQLGQPAPLAATMNAWRPNLSAFSLFALLLTIVMLVWARASLVTFALFFSSGLPTVRGLLSQLISFAHLDFLIAYFAVGSLFAVIVFAISVVSVPMMLDRGTDTVVAALTSVRALLANPLSLLVWAILIVVIIGIGFATLFLGLVIAVPVIGHATWHAYQDLVVEAPAAVVDRPGAEPPQARPTI